MTEVEPWRNTFWFLLGSVIDGDDLFRGAVLGFAASQENGNPLLWEGNTERLLFHAASPIERKALLSFTMLALVRGYDLHVTDPEPDVWQRICDIRGAFGTEPTFANRLYLTPQAGVPQLGIRPDCVIWRPRLDYKPLVVEFDGYQWHKDNFTKDRKRDRDLQLAGFDVVRYSGSEINADPANVAENLDEIVRKTQGLK